MKHCSSLSDISDIQKIIDQAVQLKQGTDFSFIGRRKALGLLFFNPSLRTRLSTEKAAKMLGMNVMIMDINKNGWSLELEEGAYMNQSKSEHVKEAAGVLSHYCDIIGIRAFPTFKSKVEDEKEQIITSFKKYATVPILNLESATTHPLQALTDAMTIQEYNLQKPKIVMTWAPHPKVLPQAVPNAFSEITERLSMDLTICNPPTHNLNSKYTKNIRILHEQENALEGADIVYVKNWSSYEQYGEKFPIDKSWTFTSEKLKLTNNAKIFHCLPVRRNVVIEDTVLDSKNSAVLNQAENRTYTAASVLYELLKNNL